MLDKHAPIKLVHSEAPGKRRTHAGSATRPLAAEHFAARRPRARALLVVARRTVRRVTRLLRLWRRRVAESNELRAMSDRELRDFGISRYDAEHEAKKAFWKASREQW